MKLRFTYAAIVMTGIFLSLNSPVLGSAVMAAMPVFPQHKTTTQDKPAAQERGETGEDENGDEYTVESAGEISSNENICNTGTPSKIKNVSSPSGDFEDLLMIRWEKRTIGGEWTVIPSATVLTHTPDPISETTLYRRGCRLSYHQPWRYSNIVTKRIIQGIEEVYVNTLDVKCKGGNDGYARATVIGGTPAYTFEWSTAESDNSAIHDLSAGFYSLTVTDANGCEYSVENFEIQEPNASVEIHNTIKMEPLCPGEPTGAIFAEARDGVAPYTFTWSDGHTGQYNFDIPSGNYNVTVKDALGCTHAVNNILLEGPDPFVLVDDSEPVTCFGGEDGKTELNMKGGTEPYLYFWEDGYTEKDRQGLAAGIYQLVVQDLNNCLTFEEFEITSPATITPEAITLDNKICKASINMVPTGGVAPYTYEWNDGSSGGYKNQLCPGLYTVMITDANGCQREETLKIRAEYAIKAIDIEVTVNPFQDKADLVIHLPYDKPANIEVYSPSGQLIESFQDRLPVVDKEIYVELDLNRYSDGLYLVNVRSAGLSGTEKIVISR